LETDVTSMFERSSILIWKRAHERKSWPKAGHSDRTTAILAGFISNLIGPGCYVLSG
jgi:hypothetical protein